MIQFFTKRLNNKKGFTLVELLIVIALLGILAGIAIPRMTGLTNDARANADEATAQTILRETQVAIVSGQIVTTETTAQTVTFTGADNDSNFDYFDGYEIPQSQVNTANTFVISFIRAADRTYTITVTAGTDTWTATADGR